MLHYAPAVFTAILLAGCASAPSGMAPMTVDDAKAALAQARTNWKDPDSIRDTKIGRPYSSGCWGAAEHIVSGPDTCVCIATNARNSFGGYTGLRMQVALMKNRRVIDFIDARPHDQCDQMAAWPEFDGRAPR